MVLAVLLLAFQAAPEKEIVRIPEPPVSIELVRLPAASGVRPVLIGTTEVTWTQSHCWPVLANSAQKNPSFPLKSKVTRAFEVDVPSSFEDVSEVAPDKFGADVVSLTFAREENK